MIQHVIWCQCRDIIFVIFSLQCCGTFTLHNCCSAVHMQDHEAQLRFCKLQKFQITNYWLCNWTGNGKHFIVLWYIWVHCSILSIDYITLVINGVLLHYCPQWLNSLYVAALYESHIVYQKKEIFRNSRKQLTNLHTELIRFWRKLIEGIDPNLLKIMRLYFQLCFVDPIGLRLEKELFSAHKGWI